MIRAALLSLLLLALPFVAAADTFLLMAEEDGCVWCERWDEEIAHIYPKTAEGRAAPLRRFDVHGADPDGVTFDTPVHFTPTFVLIRDGTEIGRIEGYPGEDFFWGLLAILFQNAQIELNQSG